MKPRSLYQLLAIITLTLSLSACATATMQKPDPYAGYNQAIFAFNQTMNRTIFNPITDLYRDVTPGFVRQGVTNFFQNLETVPDMINDLLQFNFRYFLKDTTRLLLNSTLGLGGLVDVAKDAGISAHQQGFGYTLYRWGFFRHSPYFMLPLLGPSNIRNSAGMVPDFFLNPLAYYNPDWQRYTLRSIDALQQATNNLPQLKFITENAIDPYVAVRNAYLQNQKLILRQIMSDGTSTPHESHYQENSYKTHAKQMANTPPPPTENKFATHPSKYSPHKTTQETAEYNNHPSVQKPSTYKGKNTIPQTMKI